MKKQKKEHFVSCIVAAGGSGSRMQAGMNKIFLECAGMPVLAHTLTALNQCELIDEIILVTKEADILGCHDIAEEFSIHKLKTITRGGSIRQESVYNALKEVSESADIVLIHDAARPNITDAVTMGVINGVLEYGAAATGVPCKNTLKVADENGMIVATPDRSRMYEIQTPQGFKKDMILHAHERAKEEGVIGTDDCYLVEYYGANVKITEGDYRNIKITTPEDLQIFELFLSL